jgi:D-glucosaminate-6-phosphate ammonia-lyase
MTNDVTARLYAELGVRPVINAAGAYTILGGSAPSETVRRAMDEATGSFVEMRELLASSGKIIAGLLECEAAYVTSGAAAALALSAAACMTGTDGARVERLPDTTGMKDEILIQKGLRTKYDRCVTIPGARLVEVGDASGTTADQLREAIGPRTVAVHYLAPGGQPGVLSLEQVIEVAHARGLPVIVDAAGQTYPLDNMKRFTRMGADLVCYAAKYFDAPHSTGMICGRADLIEAAAMNSFIGFETTGHLSVGRAMKVDRQEIVGLVVALREWLTMNHEERWLEYGERADRILAELKGVPGIEAYRISERETPHPVVREGIRVVLDRGAGKSAQQAAAELQQGSPSIWVGASDDALNVSIAFFNDGEEAIVARRLREVLTS